MYQKIQGIWMEIVDFDTLPELPVTGLTDSEATYEVILSKARGFIHPTFDPQFPRTGKTALALTNAIETKIITEPGKYGIQLIPGTLEYVVHTIIEE